MSQQGTTQHSMDAQYYDRVDMFGLAIGGMVATAPGTFRAQLTALRRWGEQAPAELSSAVGQVFIVHGDSDRLVPAANATELARVFPGATVTVYPDSGHGVVFQYHRKFVAAVRDFLRR